MPQFLSLMSFHSAVVPASPKHHLWQKLRPRYCSPETIPSLAKSGLLISSSHLGLSENRGCPQLSSIFDGDFPMDFPMDFPSLLGYPHDLANWRQDAKDKGTRVLAANNLDQFKIGLADFKSPFEQNHQIIAFLGQLISQYTYPNILFSFISKVYTLLKFQPSCFPSWLSTSSYKWIFFSIFVQDGAPVR